MGGLFRSGSEEGNSPGERCGEVDAAQLPINSFILGAVDFLGGLVGSPWRVSQRSTFFRQAFTRDAEHRIGLRAES